MIPHLDRIPRKVLENGAVKYGVYDEKGVRLRSEYIRREDEPIVEGTQISKRVLDELLAASGAAGGTKRDLTLTQEGFHLFDGAVVRVRLFAALADGATLNVNQSGAKPIISDSGEEIRADGGAWIELIYSAARGAYVLRAGSGGAGAFDLNILRRLGELRYCKVIDTGAQREYFHDANAWLAQGVITGFCATDKHRFYGRVRPNMSAIEVLRVDKASGARAEFSVVTKGNFGVAVGTSAPSQPAQEPFRKLILQKVHGTNRILLSAGLTYGAYSHNSTYMAFCSNYTGIMDESGGFVTTVDCVSPASTARDTVAKWAASLDHMRTTTAALSANGKAILVVGMQAILSVPQYSLVSALYLVDPGTGKVAVQGGSYVVSNDGLLYSFAGNPLIVQVYLNPSASAVGASTAVLKGSVQGIDSFLFAPQDIRFAQDASGFYIIYYISSTDGISVRRLYTAEGKHYVDQISTRLPRTQNFGIPGVAAVPYTALARSQTNIGTLLLHDLISGKMTECYGGNLPQDNTPASSGVGSPCSASLYVDEQFIYVVEVGGQNYCIDYMNPTRWLCPEDGMYTFVGVGAGDGGGDNFGGGAGHLAITSELLQEGDVLSIQIGVGGMGYSETGALASLRRPSATFVKLGDRVLLNAPPAYQNQGGANGAATPSAGGAGGYDLQQYGGQGMGYLATLTAPPTKDRNGGVSANLGAPTSGDGYGAGGAMLQNGKSGCVVIVR